MKYIKAVLPLVALLVLGAVLAGCGSASPYSPEELETMLEDAVATTVAAETFTYDMTLGMTANVTGEEAGNMYIDVDARGDADLAAREISMLMNMGLGASVSGMEVGLADITMDLYQVDGWMYARLGYADEIDDWMKTPVDATLEEEYGLDMIIEQFNLLASPEGITYLREETVAGRPCHVMDVKPDSAAIIAWFSGQDMLMGNQFGLDEIDDIASLVDTLSFTVWIDTETGHVRQLTGDVAIRITAEMLAAAGADADIGTADITVAVSMSLADFNEPVNITLPEDAADAYEISPEEFSFL